MRLIDADALLKKTINSPLHAPYITEKDIREMPTIQPVATDTNVGDTISRQEAMDALAEQMPTPYTPDGSHPADEGIFAAQEVYADCIETIKLLPPAQPEQKWIPCSETVDTPDHEIMACDRYGEFIIGYLDCKDEQWLCESDDSIMYDPVAWCELPKPYKEGDTK